MNLIEIKEYRTGGQHVKLYVNPEHIITIKKSDFSENTWKIKFVDGVVSTVDEENLNKLLSSTRSIVSNLFQ